MKTEQKPKWGHGGGGGEEQAIKTIPSCFQNLLGLPKIISATSSVAKVFVLGCVCPLGLREPSRGLLCAPGFKNTERRKFKNFLPF